MLVLASLKALHPFLESDNCQVMARALVMSGQSLCLLPAALAYRERAIGPGLQVPGGPGRCGPLASRICGWNQTVPLGCGSMSEDRGGAVGVRVTGVRV